MNNWEASMSLLGYLMPLWGVSDASFLVGLTLQIDTRTRCGLDGGS
jgi:hypothetical protein